MYWDITKFTITGTFFFYFASSWAFLNFNLNEKKCGSDKTQLCFD